jgi:hypothetical protein
MGAENRGVPPYRPSLEIEVTPEMIEAGMREIWGAVGNENEDRLRYWAAKIYRAMESARRLSRPQA